METPVQEIDKSNFNDFKTLDIVAFSKTAPGAMGDAGAVVIVTADRRVFHTNPDFGNISTDQVYQVCPPLKDCQFMTFGGGKVPQGWSTVYLGMGNYLVVRDSVFETFRRAVEQAQIHTPYQLYGAWLDIMLDILSVPDAGGRSSKRVSAIGAIAGDVVGSPYEFHNIKTKDFPLFSRRSRPTDDSVMTLAVAKALLDAADSPADLPSAAVRRMQEFGRRYPHAGYGGSFRRWIASEDPRPYKSWGNGAAMRVSVCGWAARTLEEALSFSDAVTGVTHNASEGLKGARAVTAAIFLLRTGTSMDEVHAHVRENYYPLDFTLDEIRPAYEFDVSCQGSVPQALEAFFEADCFEDAIRNAVSIGGDSDTIAAIAGSVAGAYWGIPDDIRAETVSRLDSFQRETVEEFEARFCKN
jgi:type I restriction enzyme M protein